MRERQIIAARLEEKSKRQNAHRQIVELFILSSILVFGTLAFIWLIQKTPKLNIPKLYYWNILVVTGSSMLIFLGQAAIKKNEIRKAFLLTGFGLWLGIVFGLIQLVGLEKLLTVNDAFRNILFPFSILHFVHVVAGLILITIVPYTYKTLSNTLKSTGICF